MAWAGRAYGWARVAEKLRAWGAERPSARYAPARWIEARATDR
jgi:hypothetical protein